MWPDAVYSSSSAVARSRPYSAARWMLRDRMARKDLSEKLFKADMDRFLDRDQDRALFGLPKRSAREES